MLKESYYVVPTELDQVVFDKLVPAEHYLRKVKVLIDFERFRAEVRDCYSSSMGRSAEDPVRMIKLEFLELHYNLSDREVIAEAQVNVAFRYFLDLSLDSPLPVPSLLSQFRSRLGAERHRALLNALVGQARECGLVQDRLRLKDATHVIANIAVPSAIQLVAQVRDRLLQALGPYRPEQVAMERAQARVIHQVTADLKDAERLLQRVAQLRQIVAGADAVAAEWGAPPAAADPPRRRLEAALAVAHRVLADQDDPAKGDRVRSVSDPEARRGKHGAYYDGYALDISMDEASELITAVEILPANGDEAADAAVLLAAEETAHGNNVQALSLDGIGFRGEVLRQLGDPQGLGVTVYVPVREWSSQERGFFQPTDFVWNAEHTGVRCPGGHESARCTRYAHGWRFHFRRRQCAACPLRTQCMAQLPRKHGRDVLKNDYEAEYLAARARAQGPEYAAVRSQHPKIERKLAEIVRYHGGRRARYRGRWRTQVQYLLTALVVNIKRMVRLLAAGWSHSGGALPAGGTAALPNG